jgi:ATP-dependent Zn protease
LVVGAVLIYFEIRNELKNTRPNSLPPKEITLEQFFQLVESRSVGQVIYNPNNNRVEVETSLEPKQLYFFEILNFDQFERKLQEVERELGIPPSDSTSVKFLKNSSKLPSLFSNPFIVIAALLLGLYISKRTLPNVNIPKD